MHGNLDRLEGPRGRVEGLFRQLRRVEDLLAGVLCLPDDERRALSDAQVGLTATAVTVIREQVAARAAREEVRGRMLLPLRNAPPAPPTPAS